MLVQPNLMTMELHETPKMMRDIYTALTAAEQNIESLKQEHFKDTDKRASARFLQSAAFAIGSALHYTHYAYEQVKLAEEKKDYVYTPQKQPNGELHITKEMIESLGYDVTKDERNFLEASSRFPRNKMKLWLNREGNQFGVRNDYDTRDSFKGQVTTWEQVVTIVDCIK